MRWATVAAVLLFPSAIPSGGAAAPLDDYSAEAIRSVQVATGETTKLVETGFNYAPALSPDGSRIAFACSKRASPWFPSELCTMRPNGSDRRLLTDFPDTILYEPVWSPNGQRMAFWVVRSCSNKHSSECGRYDSYAINADGSGLVRLGTNARSPSWAPDSRRLVVADRVGHDGKPRSIRMVRADGTLLARVATGDGVWEPEWSPSKPAILYSTGPTAYRRVWIENLTTHEKRGFGLGQDATWSPAGHRVAFRRRTTIYVVSPRGFLLHRISGCWSGPAWSPSGRSIAFFGEPTGPFGRMSLLIAAAGSGSRRLVAQAKFEWDSRSPERPAWSHDESTLAYAAYDSSIRRQQREHDRFERLGGVGETLGETGYGRASCVHFHSSRA